jgi:hypothetical protein
MDESYLNLFAEFSEGEASLPETAIARLSSCWLHEDAIVTGIKALVQGNDETKELLKEYLPEQFATVAREESILPLSNSRRDIAVFLQVVGFIDEHARIPSMDAKKLGALYLAIQLELNDLLKAVSPENDEAPKNGDPYECEAPYYNHFNELTGADTPASPEVIKAAITYLKNREDAEFHPALRPPSI